MTTESNRHFAKLTQAQIEVIAAAAGDAASAAVFDAAKKYGDQLLHSIRGNDISVPIAELALIADRDAFNAVLNAFKMEY